MKIKLPLPDNKKLTVIFRVEPGCLGPDGSEYVEAFCRFAEKEFAPVNSGFIRWSIIPMYDKSFAEIDYKIGSLGLTQDKVARYLNMFDKNADEFEEEISIKISELITQYSEK
ncbi:MAG: hypothetical protein OQK75_07145 [Gammaproteobacteria bacterium]|nr:hypothetical protein [Gammaproteobacteria bacterium]MCW8987434.1 hypothetical protein [Gammaproteobacteria bacterium]